MNIVDTRELSQQEFEGLALDQPFLELLGYVEWSFSMLVWGRAGSGKSTFAMGLARALLPFAKLKGGRVLYVSSEEGPHMTTALRAGRLGALDEDLLISDFRTIRDLREAILRHNIVFLIVDSVTVVDPSTAEARDFLRWCRREGIGIALIAHALKSGDGYKGNSRLGHDIYVEVECYQDEGGVHRARTIKNRYKPLAEIETPMTGREIVRTNPDCSTSPQSAQCKAIFASLDERKKKRSASKRSAPAKKKKAKSTSSKKKTPAAKRSASKKRRKKSASKKSSSKEAKPESSSSARSEEAKSFDAGLSRIEKQLEKIANG